MTVSRMQEPAVKTDFSTDGYTILRGLLSPPEVGLAQRRVDQLLTQPGGESCARPNNTLVPLRWNDPLVAAVAGDRDRARRVAEAVAAEDLRWISGYVSVKEPHSAALWWHQDWWCWDHPVSYRRTPPQITVLCYLTDTDVHNGALRLLPGSHRQSTPLHAALPEAHSDASIALDRQHVAMVDQPGQVTPDVRAGDAVVTDYRLLHGTHANISDRRRDCVLLNFAPSWASLPNDIKGHLIRNPALPGVGEDRSAFDWSAQLLPAYDGPQRDLELNRNAPAKFTIS